MSAENIARVVADLNAGNVARASDGGMFGFARKLWKMEPVTVIDATAIYDDLAAVRRELNYYDDFPSLQPPWFSFAVCYQNQHGNVMIMHSLALDRIAARRGDDWLEIERWETENEVDWTAVRWTVHTFVWCGGWMGGGEPAPTHGPRHLWQSAIYADGRAADLHWVRIVDDGRPLDEWDMPWLVNLAAVNYLNCRNVDIVEPSRPRAERRRIARTGVRVHTINVFPTGKSTRSVKGAPVGSVPLHPVRGHPAHYGNCCPGVHEPRGLLFGRLEGKFWIPQHVRGAEEHGKIDHDYKLVPGDHDDRR